MPVPFSDAHAPVTPSMAKRPWMISRSALTASCEREAAALTALACTAAPVNEEVANDMSVEGVLLIAESQASDVSQADPSAVQGFLSQYMTAPTQRSWTSVIDDKPAFTSAKEEEKDAEKLLANGSNTPITLGAIGVGLLALVTMLGARMRRGLQPATVLAGMEMQSQAQVSNIFYSGGDDAKLGAGGMADTRDPEPFVNETDKRQSISQAPSFEEYLKSRQFAADSRKSEINHGRIGLLGLLGSSVFEKSPPFHSGASWPVKTELVSREWDPLNLSGPSSGWKPTPAVFFKMR